jgi:hypothetical protein
MATLNDRLAYNPTAGGSGSGYTAWSPSSEIAVAGSGWTAASGGFAWWLGPTYNNATNGIIARLESAEDRPVGPWTWNASTVTDPALGGAGGILTDNGKFDLGTAVIYISEKTYTSISNGIGPAMEALNPKPYNIYVRGAGTTRPFYTVYSLAGVNLNVAPGYHALNVSYVSGDSTYSLVDGQRIGISTVRTVTQAANRSRGTFGFFRVNDISTPNEAARLGVILGIPGVNDSSTLAQIKASAQATSNFYVSW